MRKINVALILLAVFSSVNSFANADDAYACETFERTQFGVPVASLVVYNDSSVGQKLSVMLGDRLPTPYTCSKSEGSVDGSSYALYTCSESIENQRAILSIDKDELDANLDLEVNGQTYEMTCELNPTIRR